MLMLGALPLAILAASPQRVALSALIAVAYVGAAAVTMRRASLPRATFAYVAVVAGLMVASWLRARYLLHLQPEQLDYAKMQITSPNYELRPEIIESTYYLYHYTHDAKYLAMGRTYFSGLVKYCRTDDAYAALVDVRSKQKKDSMESFFFAETLKYLYLLFAPETTLDFDSVIFNTEAHPLKRSLGITH